jgi:hypothetical protein
MIFNFLALSLVIVAFYGYVLNAVTLFYLGPVTGEVLVRFLGMIFPPLGAILGFVPT